MDEGVTVSYERRIYRRQMRSNFDEVEKLTFRVWQKQVNCGFGQKNLMNFDTEGIKLLNNFLWSYLKKKNVSRQSSYT